MKKISFTILCVIFLCTGCATPDKLRKDDMRGISSLSIVISTTITRDVSGFTDSVDLPLNNTLNKSLLDLTKNTLQDKNYQITDQHLSVGNAYSSKKYYVLANENDRERELSKLEKKPGPFYSDRLTAEQLTLLFEDLEDHDDIPKLGTMGFQGDATFVMQVQGRLIGKGKSIGAKLANIGIMAIYIAGGGGTFGGSPDLMDTNDSYQVQMRLYSTKSGDILWQSDIKDGNGIENTLKAMVKILQERIPG